MPHTPSDVDLQPLDPRDLERLLPLVETYHKIEDIQESSDELRRILSLLLENPTYGTAYGVMLSGQMVGYIVIVYGFTIEWGGREAVIDEFYLIPEVQGHGIGGIVLDRVVADLTANGFIALNLEVNVHNDGATRLYARKGFEKRYKYHFMTLEPLPGSRRAAQKVAAQFTTQLQDWGGDVLMSGQEKTPATAQETLNVAPPTSVSHIAHLDWQHRAGNGGVSHL